MALNGVPPSGQFPERGSGAPIIPYVQSTRGLEANRGYAKFNTLRSLYTDTTELAAQFGFDATSGQYYNPDMSGPIVNSDVITAPEAPARLTDTPTSSSNYRRPRTVAAGYDESRKVMTVVFRDGTVYNYYGVTSGEWEGFHAAISKGKAGLNRHPTEGIFIGKERGVADMTTLPADVQEQLYRTIRSQQIYRNPKSFKEVTSSTPKYRSGVAGSNPAKGGTNPAQRKRRSK